MFKHASLSSKLAVLFLFFLITASAQHKTGNIVEYFGKEKAGDLTEGDVVYVFKKGLALKIRNFTFNSSSFPKDPVFNRFLMNNNYTVKKDEVFDIDASGNEMVWKEINVDHNNSFNNPDLRTSYVYLTYKSGSNKRLLLEASGHSLLLINGLPHEGDHYDFGYNLVPVNIKKGLNVFVLKVGRFPRIRARLLKPHQDILFTPRDLTLPDLLNEEQKDYYGAIKIINNSDQWMKNYIIESDVYGSKSVSNVPAIAPMSVRKVPFLMHTATDLKGKKEAEIHLALKNRSGSTIAKQIIKTGVRSKYKHHKNTFISNIDGSVQYYSVAPSTDHSTKNQALFFSVHGASVEAVNQANAYKQKDWGNLVAPTNRRPFGFAWEDWGRLDALEVLNDAKRIYKPDENRIYLTGHSMGGHGTWYLGATYPDKFASIAPCAGYPDLILYRDSFLKETLKLPMDQLKKMGFTEKDVERLKTEYIPNPVERMIKRAGTPSRTLELIRNYLHYGVYIFHGEKDNVVPTEIARDMRKRLGTFHNDFTYYEYPGGQHWFGNHSVDWPPIFEMFSERSKKDPKEIKKIEFYTGSPGVSATSNFITIVQQLKPFEVSSFKFSREDSVKITTKNVALLKIDAKDLNDTIKKISIDGTALNIKTKEINYFKNISGKWNKASAPALQEKGPHRNGGFKDAFRNKMVFVYATKGSAEENKWYFNRARFDAETFRYRANGSVEVIKDVNFNPAKYPDRNIILYGNRSNNNAWNKLLGESPIQVSDNEVRIGNKKLSGTQWGMYFIYPRKDSDFASIGVVTATGEKGMKAAYMNHYLVNGTTFPDVTLFDDSVLKEGERNVKCAGFFGNDWSIDKGDFEWN
ncbi:MAG: alpha/beta hydrolase [Flavobacteriia bacterium]|nr:MAG: alpha/beta hydrolase [Flavobacteriia bacterium]